MRNLYEATRKSYEDVMLDDSVSVFPLVFFCLEGLARWPCEGSHCRLPDGRVGNESYSYSYREKFTLNLKMEILEEQI